MFSSSHRTLSVSHSWLFPLWHTGHLAVLQTPKACLCPRAFAHALPLACSIIPQIPSHLGAPSLDLDFLSKVRSLLTPLYTVTSESHSSRYPFIDFFLTIAWLIVCCSCTDLFWWEKKNQNKAYLSSVWILWIEHCFWVPGLSISKNWHRS